MTWTVGVSCVLYLVRVTSWLACVSGVCAPQNFKGNLFYCICTYLCYCICYIVVLCVIFVVVVICMQSKGTFLCYNKASVFL